MDTASAARDRETRPDPEREEELAEQEDVARLLRHLRTRPDGLTEREAARRLETDGPNELVRGSTNGLWAALGRQLIHPLALLLWLAAALSALTGSVSLPVAIVVVIVLNAVFAVLQERHAERAVEALASYLPQTTRVLRDGLSRSLPARELVRGDVVRVSEGERVSADARVISGTVSVDLSMLTGESVPVVRTFRPVATPVPPLEADDLLFSGTTCTQGNAVAVVIATGMRTELGRIATLSQRVRLDVSPLERQVTRVARIIALVALGLGLAFIPVGTLIAGLSLRDSLSFAIGLLVANVPEGLLPTITLALALGVLVLARQGAIVKRISAVETLGSTSVICTDKTGTLTLNQMTMQRCWTPDGTTDLSGPQPSPAPSAAVRELLFTCAACTDVSGVGAALAGDPTEVAIRRAADAVAAGPMPVRLAAYPFDPVLRRMTTVDQVGATVWAHAKGAPEDLLACCTHMTDGEGERPLTEEDRSGLLATVADWAATGLRVLAVAQRELALEAVGRRRNEVETGLTLLGLVAMIDPPRPEVRAAVESCHRAGIRLIVITGDHGLTARGVAQRVGIGDAGTPVITGAELESLSDSQLDDVLDRHGELIFARSSPEAKLRIADALRSLGHVVAMTGDGVNDAPALRRADIGVAMGRSGTDVAREASTMILTDDNFSTIVTAVESGRRVYENVRKFVIYIFAHATPEVVPFLLYALSGGRIPLPLTVIQILTIDLGTETLPALALGREPAEPGLMDRPPRLRTQNVIDGPMLVRAWGLLGGTSAVIVTTLFLATLLSGGWRLGDDVATGPLNHVWHQATTMTFLGIVACQIGTAMAARTHTASLRRIGLWSNPLLLWGIAFEIVFSVTIVALEPLQTVFGTAVPPAWLLLALLPAPVLTWGVDEVARAVRRRTRPDPSMPSDDSLSVQA